MLEAIKRLVKILHNIYPDSLTSVEISVSHYRSGNEAIEFHVYYNNKYLMFKDYLEMNNFICSMEPELTVDTLLAEGGL